MQPGSARRSFPELGQSVVELLLQAQDDVEGLRPLVPRRRAARTREDRDLGRERVGPTLSIFKKLPDGRWVLFRDANLLAAKTG